MRKLLLVVAAAIGFTAVACSAATNSPNYQQGQQYQLVQQVVPPTDAKKIRVQEFFWYGCPHCYHADPIIRAWDKTKAKDVDFERVPDTLGRQIGVLHQRAYYIAKVLGILDKTHVPMFKACYPEGGSMRSLQDVEQLYENVAGISKAQFEDASSSFVVDSDMRTADQLAQTYGVMSTPTIVVGGKYVTDGQMAGSSQPGESEDASFKRMMKVVDYLVEKVRKERGL